MLELFDFSGKSVCVTGAASGIGRATADLFLSLGATVIYADREAAALRQIADEAASDRLRTVAYDQADAGSVKVLAEQVEAVDVLINNAGILVFKPYLDHTQEEIDQVIDVDYRGAVLLSQHVGRAMVQRRRGVIIHTGSQLTFNGAESRAIYASSKAAITQFVKTTALEWGQYGVRVNCVAPGRTLTPLNARLLDDKARAEAEARIPLGRLGQPADIAHAFVFLASEAAGYITGTTLVVDGGWILP
jgi:NAD(P)-dependent dehydrogenase (short-subunit alcohol dehydrogenase family)